MNRALQLIFLSLLFPLFSSIGFAEEQSLLKVYLDCRKGSCDQDFLKRELNFIEFVRNREDSQAHALITRERNATGRKYTLFLYGGGEFSEDDFGLTTNTLNVESDDQKRRKVLKTLQLGLVPYLIKSGQTENLNVSVEGDYQRRDEKTAIENDPWNRWVFRSEIGGKFEDEDSRDEKEHWGYFSANRVTDSWRMGLGMGQRDRERTFVIDDGSSFVDKKSSNWLSGAIIKSMSDHWSLGLGASNQQSTYYNLENGSRIAGAIEYNIFPYQLSSEKELKFGYFVGLTSMKYEQVTILGELEETRTDHGLFAEFDVDQPWGNISLDFRTSQMLDDTSLYRASIGGNLEYRISRGLSLNLWGESSLVQDQVYLAAQTASNEEILLGTSALDTDTKTKMGVSLKYTFGSIYNSVVNNRLQGSNFARVYKD